MDELIAFSRDLEQVTSELRRFGWDADTPHVELAHGQVISVLERFRKGELTAKQVEDWANAVEGREDIDLSEPVGEAIFILANPELNAPLTLSLAEEIQKGLRFSSPDKEKESA